MLPYGKKKKDFAGLIKNFEMNKLSCIIQVSPNYIQ